MSNSSFTSSFYFFRHGLATYSTTGYGDQILTADLLPEGKEDAQQIATFLQTVQPVLNNNDLFFVSPVKRCQQTVAIISPVIGHTFITDERIRENYQESLTEVELRLRDFMNHYKDLGKRFFICTHGIVISGLTHLLLENVFLPKDELDFPQPGDVRVVTAAGRQEISLS